MLTLADLQAISGSRTRSPVALAIVKAFNTHAAKFGITHQEDIADFLAHVCVETGGFRNMSESLNYSVSALTKMFGRHRILVEEAQKYGRSKSRKANQIMIANTLYGGSFGRKNLGNTSLGDGWAFRGSGPGQVTGRANFLRAQNLTGIPFISNPDLMRDPEKGMIASLALWQAWNMNKYQGGSNASRKKWNGGEHGLAGYKAAYARAMKRKLSVVPAIVPAPEPRPEPLPPIAIEEPAEIEDALRKDGSRTIENADKSQDSIFKRLISMISSGGVSIISYLQGVDWRIIAVIALAGVLAYAIFEYRSYKAAQAIKAARVNDAITGKNVSRLARVKASLGVD